MAQALNPARIEICLDAETKQLAERASAALGCASLTEFMVRLIHDNAPGILEQQSTIRQVADRFDQFIAACQRTDLVPSQKLKEAAQRLDTEGY